MTSFQRQSIAWVIASGLTIAGCALLGWASAQRDVAQADRTLAKRGPAPGALSLPIPPTLPPVNQDSTTPASPATVASRSAIPPPGGFPVSVLHEMWEISLKTPRKIGDTPLTAENWYISGVFMRGNEQQVIVQRMNDPKPHFHKVGDTLPGGARIAWVRPNAIGLITPKSEQISLPLQR